MSLKKRECLKQEIHIYIIYPEVKELKRTLSENLCLINILKRNIHEEIFWYVFLIKTAVKVEMNDHHICKEVDNTIFRWHNT